MEHSTLSPAARLDLDGMRAIVAIAEARTVTLAAGRLGRTPAAISMQLKKLEETIGRPLFNRTRAGMTPTPDGERLLPFARRLVETERAAREAFALEPLAGRLRLGMIDDLAGLHMDEILSAFAASHPGVVIELTVAQSAILAPMLDRDELDVALLTTGGAVAWRDNDLFVLEEPLVWASGLDGSAWTRRPLPLALSSEGCAWRRITLDSLDRAGIPYRVAVQSDSSAAMAAAVRSGLAVSPLPAARLGPGIRAISEAEGAPPIGASRIAIRRSAQLDSGPCCVDALITRIVECFGSMPSPVARLDA
ncbi:MAG: LysR substrate-binding domain-containing protein [Pseudomonadota bacterium]